MSDDPSDSRQAGTDPDPRVFLVVVDDTPELETALRYASLRAKKSGGRVALLYVIEPGEFQHWMSVGDLMREEARGEAEKLLQRTAGKVIEYSGAYPILYLREGTRREELLELIDEDPFISILVLGASTHGKGPGPLVSALTGKFLSRLRVPLTLVPDSLDEEELERIS